MRSGHLRDANSIPTPTALHSLHTVPNARQWISCCWWFSARVSRASNWLARLENASYREIATVLFNLPDMPDAVWQSHELSGQIIRLAKLGADLMQGGYRNLLLYPYRRRP